MLCSGDASRHATLWAKSGTNTGRCTRRHFRHELASSLAWLQVGPADQSERDLVAYLIAAHHGKVRLSIRSLPGEAPPFDCPPETRMARGILDGDEVPPQAFTALGLEPSAGNAPLKLDLGLMEMGFDSARGLSWLARMSALRDRFGLFPLAYLETLLRAADARASAGEAAGSAKTPTSASPDMELRDKPPASGTTEALSPTEQALVADLVADGLSIQEKFRPEPLYKVSALA